MTALFRQSLAERGVELVHDIYSQLEFGPMPHSPQSGAYATSFPALLLIATAISACAPPASETKPATDHGSHADEATSLHLTAASAELAVYVDYPPTVSGKQSRFAVHLTDPLTGSPMQPTKVRLDFLRDGEVAQRVEQSESAQPGLYVLGSFLPEGKYQVHLELIDPKPLALVLGELEVYADESAASLALHDFEHMLPSEAVQFTVEQQWNVGLRTAALQQLDLAERIEIAAQVVQPAHAQAVIRAPFAGAWVMPAGKAFPQLGQRVTRGEILGEVQLSLSAADRAAVEANELSRHEHEKEIQLREFDLRVREVEAAQAAALAESSLEFTAAELERLAALFDSGLAKQSEVALAQANQRSAQLSYEAAQELLNSLAEVRGELEKLHSEELQADPLERNAQLVAPIDGILVELGYSQGEWVPATGALMRVVDPSQRWIELRIPESSLQQGAELPSVQIAIPGGDQHYDLQRDWQGEQRFRAAQVDPQTRCLSVYATCPGAPQLAEGMRLRAALATRSVQSAWAIPRSAVVDEAGIPVVFVLVTGEIFEKRAVRLGVQDGDWVEVLSGVEEGELVVSSAAYLLRLAAANSENFGHGHVH